MNKKWQHTFDSRRYKLLSLHYITVGERRERLLPLTRSMTSLLPMRLVLVGASTPDLSEDAEALAECFGEMVANGVPLLILSDVRLFATDSMMTPDDSRVLFAIGFISGCLLVATFSLSFNAALCLECRGGGCGGDKENDNRLTSVGVSDVAPLKWKTNRHCDSRFKTNTIEARC